MARSDVSQVHGGPNRAPQRHHRLLTGGAPALPPHPGRPPRRARRHRRRTPPGRPGQPGLHRATHRPLPRPSRPAHHPRQPGPRLHRTPPPRPDRQRRHAGPKYLNTADTALFHKGAQLYGAIPALFEQGATPVLVEGPFDALAVTLAGNARYVGVAPLGTALTDEQARQLATLSTSPIIATDADPAGRAAAQRDFWLLAQHGTDPRTTELPAGTDPASILTAAGPTTLRDHLDSAQPLGRALLDDLLNQPQPKHAGHGRRAHRRPAPTGLASTGKPGLPAAGHRCHGSSPTTGCAGPDMEQRPRECRRQRHRQVRPAAHAPPGAPADPWVSLADRVDPRLTSEPDWLALANMLTAIHENGADAQRLVQEAMARGPLDEVPAQDLRYRLAALHQAPPHPYADPEPNHRNADRGEDHLPHTGRDRAPTPRPSR